MKSTASLLLLVLLWTDLAFSQHISYGSANYTKYEYYLADQDAKTPLIVLLPGFTQHSLSAEFLVMKEHFLHAGYSYLVVDFPLHGTNDDFAKVYTWGKDETASVLTILSDLPLLDHHDEVHLLGFSIGANVALQIGASETSADWLTSIIAVAAPDRVGDIDIRLAGSLGKPMESLASSIYAVDRSSLTRLLYMIIIGMPVGLVENEPTPGSLINQIEVPTLFIHGANDWLTKSYHSAKMVARGGVEQQLAFVPLNTPKHAEDMISRGPPALREAFLQLVENWLAFTDKRDLPEQKEAFQASFEAAIEAQEPVDTYRYPRERITLMSEPGFNDLYTNLWYTSPQYNHALLSYSTIQIRNNRGFSRHFTSIGSTALDPSLLQRFRLGLAFEHDNSLFQNFETYLSLYQPFGSFLWVRRLNFIAGLGNEYNRRIMAVDFAYTIVDFQISYGRFFTDQDSWLLTINAPLIGEASGLYFLGFSHSRFLNHHPYLEKKSNFKVYAHLGPKLKPLNGRVQLTLQFDTSGPYELDVGHTWSAGLLINLEEQ